MFKAEVCPECGRALEGAIEVSSAQVGGLNVVVMRETPDRNWIDCDGCSRVICKSCCALPESGYCNSCFFKLRIEPYLPVQFCRHPEAQGVTANQKQNLQEQNLQNQKER